MRVKSKNRNLFYRFFEILKLNKLALYFGRGYKISGEGLSDKSKHHSPIKVVGSMFIFISLFFVLNYIVNFIRYFFPQFKLAMKFLVQQNIQETLTIFEGFSYLNITYLLMRPPNFIMIVMLLISASYTSIQYYKLGRKFDKLNHGQEGDARLVTLKELKDQYPLVPDIKERFEGIGGIPVSHYNNQYFIDTNTVNSLGIGTSRSGKGESIIFPHTDIVSRAREQCSMIFNDPKGELYVGSKVTLEERGYEVQVLNVLNPDQSMSYNPLQLIIDAYVQGDQSSAQMLVDQFTYALFNAPDAGANKWVYSGAQKMVNGVILALIDFYAKKQDLGKVTMYNVAQWIVEMSQRKQVNPATGAEKTEMDSYFERLPQGHIAKAQYSSFSSMDAKNKAPIQSAVLDTITIFQGFETIAKMTSKNSFKLKSVGFPKSLLFQFNRTMYDQNLIVRFYRGDKVIGKEKIRPNIAGVVDLNFNIRLKTGDKLLVENSNQSKVATYHIKLHDKKDGEVTLINSTFKEIKQIDLYYTDKPIAVFMITPDFDPSKNILSSMFVKQLYTTLAQNASMTRGNKCFRRVIFDLDEFGNMPAIESIEQILTVCLGRNIIFNLFIQSYAQLPLVYNENVSKIIKENCQNHLYIMSRDKDTHEEISEAVGSRTVQRTSKSSNDPMKLETGTQESISSERIIPSYKVKTLLEGEMIVTRIHRQSKKRQKVRPYAIFSTELTAMPFRHEFLAKYFEPAGSIEDFDIPSEHKTFELHRNQIDIDQMITESQENSTLFEEIEGVSDGSIPLMISEEEFKKALFNFEFDEINGFISMIKNSVDSNDNLLEILKSSKNNKISEDVRIAFLQFANTCRGEEYYNDILNQIRLD